MIISNASKRKVMYFKETMTEEGKEEMRERGVRFKNNAVAALFRFSGGFSSKYICHKVTDCENSFALGLELAK
jgi:hypothetical protein